MVSDLGNTTTLGVGNLVYVFADNNNDGTDDLPIRNLEKNKESLPFI